MAIHGKNGRVFVNGFNLTSYSKSASLDQSIDTVEVTTLGNDSKKYIKGLDDVNFTNEGIYDDDASTLDLALHNMKGVESILSYYPSLDTKGNYGYGLKAIRTSANTAVSITEEVNYSLSAQGSEGTDRIISITPEITVDEDSSTIALDLGVGGDGTDGGVLYFHTTAITGNVTVTVEDSTDNVTFETLHSIGAVTTTSGIRVVLTGDIDRYIRVTLSDMVAESITFQAGIKVN